MSYVDRSIDLAEEMNKTLLPWGVAVIFARMHKSELEVLAVECSSKGYPGCWSLPGGSPEPNETLEQAAAREAFEETGLRPEDLVSVGVVISGTEERPCFTQVFVARAIEWLDLRVVKAGAPQGSEEGPVAWVPFRRLAAGPYSRSIHAIAAQIGYRM